jgi:hypothetical protein
MLIVQTDSGVVNMEFPVVTEKNRIVNVRLDADSLARCTKLGFKKGWFEGLRVIDSNGLETKIQGARDLRYTGQRLFRGWFAPRVYQVTLEFAPAKPIGLDSFKAEASRWITSILTEGDSREEATEAMARIAKAINAKEVMDILVPILAA